MFYGDRKALEALRNCSICIADYGGIRNTKSQHDISKELLVYVENIPRYNEPLESHVINEGEMVRYKPIKFII